MIKSSLLRKFSNKPTREIPAYTFAEASRYLNVSVSTIRAWFLGVKGSTQFTPPLKLSNPEIKQLSFINLIEAHVLCSLRRNHRIGMPQIRKAIKYIEKEFATEHPLTDGRLKTARGTLFLDKISELIDLKQQGQLAIKEVFEKYLQRIEYNENAYIPVKFYPFTRPKKLESPCLIEINPDISFGKPVIKSAGVPTEIILELFQAGDDINDIAEDYNNSVKEIQEAIRFENFIRRAA